MLIKSLNETVMGTRGTPVSVLQCLIHPGHKPNGGWTASITVNGTKMPLVGKTPNDVVESLRKILVQNKIKFTENELWTTLNLQWLNKADFSYHRVVLRDFIRQCDIPSDQPSFRGKIDREDWLPAALDTIGFYLCIDSDKFRYADFAALVSCVIKMTDPGIAHRLGDGAVFSTLLERYSVIRYKPCHLLDEAKDWFITTFNALATIRKVKPTDKATATTKYSWNNETQD